MKTLSETRSNVPFKPYNPNGGATATSWIRNALNFMGGVRAAVAAVSLASAAAACSTEGRVEYPDGRRPASPTASPSPTERPTPSPTPTPTYRPPTPNPTATATPSPRPTPTPTPPPLDTDGDGIPNTQELHGCEARPDNGRDDRDHDRWCDAGDNAPDHYNPDQADRDLDGIADVIDNDPEHPNPAQTDSDNDGHGSPGDCDDNDDEIPGPEVCDGRDNDCNDETDPNCECQPLGQMRSTGSNVGRCEQGQEECVAIPEALGGGSQWEPVLNATGPVLEICNGDDDDCNGAADDGLPNCDCVPGVTSPRECGSDEGECAKGTQTCQQDGTWSGCVGQREASNEVCDRRDNDCDGQTDEDFDVGQACVGTGACGIGPAGVRECASANETRCSVDPGGSRDRSRGEEFANELDDDCNGRVDDASFSVVGGGSGQTARMGEACHRGAESGVCRTDGVYVSAGDRAVRCNAEDPAGGLDPRADETRGLCDQQDNDCDGSTDEGCACHRGEMRDCGSDTGACEHGTQACDGNGAWGNCQGGVGPAAERCNRLDDDCDSVTDNFPNGTVGQPCPGGMGACAVPGQWECTANGFGVQCSTDIGGSQSRVRTEVCNVDADGRPVDDDCNGQVNEGNWPTEEDPAVARPFGVPCNPQGDVCGPGHMVCATGTSVACDTWLTRPIKSETEGTGFCNDRDDNCDGATDEGCVGDCSEGQTRSCGNALGICEPGVQTCDQRGAWGRCEGGVGPTAEVCDGLDNDCNGATDNGFAVNTPCNGIGECDDGRLICTADGAGVACSTNPGQPNDQSSRELCDGKDNNCNRTADDGLTARDGTNLGLPGMPCPLPGECVKETVVCDGSFNTKCSEGGRAGLVTERCDGRDNDCDGATDENFRWRDREIGAACDIQGECVGGVVECDPLDASQLSARCSAIRKRVAEVTGDGFDNDCDGQTDE